VAAWRRGVAVDVIDAAAKQHRPAELVRHIFWGRHDDVAMRFGGGLGLLSPS
jgi:hypothetical protein